MKILIGNRGEIACRIIKTCKRLGFETVGIYTPADKFSKHVKEVDFSIALPSGPLKENYLNLDLIIQGAIDLDVKAVHPGYGFFSESAEACLKFEKAGITWIGPTYRNILETGCKHQSKQAAIKCNVPTCNYIVVKSLEDCLEASESLKYPVMLKLSGGGGGHGMFKCLNSQDVRESFSLAEETNRSLYANTSDIFVEKLVLNAHHIEVQIVGDGQGEVVVLGERECSIQRRNQKVIEETPSPFLDSCTRERLLDAAKRLGSYLNYKSVGTVEFLVDDDTTEFYFLEINTRLQVEHTITEMTFNVDLVELMIRIALPNQYKKSENVCIEDTHFYAYNFGAASNQRSQVGHAIEARICAEDPLNNFKPSFGRISHVVFKQTAHIRIDTWIENDSFVSPLYDSLLAKVIGSGETRVEAICNLIDSLENSKIQGITTNIDFAVSILKSELFSRGITLTNFLNTFAYKSFTCEVIEAGMLSLIQDYPGRVGYWNIGCPPSGPMDSKNFRIANYLVGNNKNDAGIEILLDGLVLKFYCEAIIAVTGASCVVKIDGVNNNFNMYEMIKVAANSVLEVRLNSQIGCRAYLAIQGGIPTVPYLGSRSTFVAGNFGGLNGEALKIGDSIPLMEVEKLETAETGREKMWPKSRIPILTNEWEILAMAGPHGLDYFTSEDVESIWRETFEVNHNANRLGIRLNARFSPKWVRTDGGDAGGHPSNVHDYPYSIGSLNFSGNFPIILTVDGPSLGGFVCPLTVIQTEMWKVGQLRPGDLVRFKRVSYDYAIASLKKEADLLLQPFSEDEDKQEEATIIVNPYTSPVFDTCEKGSNNPKAFFRYSGDSHVLVDLEMASFEIENRFFIQYIINVLKKENNASILELVPGVSSLLIKYDPFKLTSFQIAKEVSRILHSDASNVQQMKIECRNIKLPLAFKDRWSLEAIAQYMKTICSKAPYLPENCEFVRQINDLDSLDQLSSLIKSTKYLVLGLGDVYLGAPCAVPYDPRHRIVTTKYNPARTFTPEGAVGIGGIYMCIYGMNSPGGYQLVGKTINIWSNFANPPWLLDFFDMVQFYLVSDEELVAIRDDYKMGKYSPSIEPTTLSLLDYKKFIEINENSIVEYKKSHDIKTITSRIDWSKSEHYEIDNASNNDKLNNDGTDYENCHLLKSSYYGNLYEIKIKEGEAVRKDQPLALIEIMKTYHQINSPVDGVCQSILVQPGQIVKQNQLIMAIKNY